MIDSILKEKLRACLGDKTDEELSLIKEQSKKDEEKYYQKKYGKVRDEKIPRFYFALPKETEIVKLKLREEARAVFLQRKSRELIDNDELQKLWFTLAKGSIFVKIFLKQSNPIFGRIVKSG